MGFLAALGLLQRGDLRFGQHNAVLGHLGFQRLQPLLGVLHFVALPDAAYAEGRDGKALLLQLVGHPGLAPGRLLDRHCDDGLLDLRVDAVLQGRLAPADFDQRHLAAGLVQVLEAVEAVPGEAQHLAGLADVAELLGQFQHAEFAADDLLG
jgi:hypothetical protein